MHDDDDIIEKRQKLSAKKAQKKGVLASETLATDAPFSGEQAIVASVHGNTVSLLVGGLVREGFAPASIMTQLVVGDRVGVEAEMDALRVMVILPRRTLLKRTRNEGGSRHRGQEQRIAANIDTAVIVATASQPDFEPELVDRYIALCRASGIEPIVCLNKADLSDIRHPALDLYRAQRVLVIETSPKTGLGMEALREALRGKISILLGKSGAGKSTLTNALLPGANIKTQEMSVRAGQGQHTTTRSDIHVWETDSYVIDTPGIRMLDVSHLDDDDISLGFPDILELAQGCKFADCQHGTEPGCRVREAKEKGELAEWRWESYRKLKTSDG